MKFAIAATVLTAGMIFTSAAQAAPDSGMLLGVYAFSNYQGLRVTGTIPGYSAEGRIFSGDVLRRVTADGIDVYSTRTHWQIEFAKDQIGPYRSAALEVFRPGVGIIYLWVEFQPVGGVAAYSTNGAVVPKKFEAKILTEQEKPGAAKLFKQNVQPAPAPTPKPWPKPNNGFGNGSAASLFGN